MGVKSLSLPKEARLSAGFSLEEAAKKLDISAGYLSQIENGQRQISSKRAEEIANLYNREREEIFLPSRYAIRKVRNHSA
jgi:transcriptional regulator with XRE-family HTH domain